MLDFLGAIKDPEFRSAVAQGLKDAANRSAASFFGGPVDLAAMAMRPMGYSTPDRDVVGGSEWIGKQMEQRGIVSSARNPIAEFLASVAVPAGIARAAPSLFRAEQQAVQNAMAPRTLNPQTGAIYSPGGLTKNKDDAQKLAERIKLLGPEYVPKLEEASGGSVYVTVEKYPLKKDGSPMFSRRPTPVDYKARFADHPSYWGSTISSDPITGNSVDTAFEMLRHKIGLTEEPDLVMARFNPAEKYGTITESVTKNVISHRGNEIRRKVNESRPFTFYEPR